MSIPKQDSAVIKGILTILIVIGHNHIVAPQNSPLMSYLYTFHVVCFFILPWMYDNKKELSLKNAVTLVVRNWTPYVFFFAFSLGVYSIMGGGKDISLESLSTAFVIGSQKLLKENTGFFFLWFLPTFCTFSLLKMIGEKWRIAIITISLLSVGTFFISWHEAEWMKNHLPFGMFTAVKYYIYGIAVYYMLSWREWTKYIWAIAFVILSWRFWGCDISWYGVVLMPVAGFMSILSVTPLLRMRWLKAIGEYSLPIYLTHVYIYNAMELAVPHKTVWGIVALVCTIAGSYAVSFGAFKIGFIRKLVFPRSFKDWKETFK